MRKTGNKTFEKNDVGPVPKNFIFGNKKRFSGSHQLA